MEIEMINKEKTFSKVSFDIELELNKKVFEIKIEESTDLIRTDCNTSWEFKESSEEATDEESDVIDDWVSGYNYL